MPRDLKLAVLLSGGGTTLANLLDWRDSGDLHAEIELVVSSRPGARGLKIAEQAGIRTEVVEAKNFVLGGREGEIIRDWTRMSRIRRISSIRFAMTPGSSPDWMSAWL